MGRVCLGRTIGPGGFERLVAIKLLHEHLGRRRGFVEMFLDEARIAARIRHPNVVPVLEVGEDSGHHFIAMDYVSGETMARALSRLRKHERRMPLALAAHLAWAGSEGLHAAHELRGPDGSPLNVVHRDVSPENLIIGYDGTLRVTDFGVVKFADQSWETAPGTWKGKAGYLSPELIQGRPIDRRADVFGVGIVLWEATIGEPLFRSENPFTSAEKIRDAIVPPPSSIISDYPRALEEIVLRALAREPEQRFSTARELGEALRGWLAATGQQVTHVEVERFMGALFADRLRRRLDMERRASFASAQRSAVPSIDPEPVPKTIAIEPIVAESLLDSPRGPLAGLDAPLSTPIPGEGSSDPAPAVDDPLLSALMESSLPRANPADPNARPAQPPPREPEGPERSWSWLWIALLLAAGAAAAVFFSRGGGSVDLVRDQTSTSAYRRVSTPEIDPRGTIKKKP